MRAFLLTLCLVAWATSAQALELTEPLKPFKALYSATYNGRNLTGSRQLYVNDGQWHLKSEFKTLFASISESSKGRISNQLDLSVDRYDYQRKILGIKKRQSRVFNYDAHTVAYDDGKTNGNYSLPKNAFDTASQQLYIREMLMRGETKFSMHMAARTNLKHLQFAATHDTSLTLPMGTIKTIRVDRVETADSKRKISMWFSPSHDYQLVKLSQTEADGKGYEMVLTKVQ